MPTLTYYFIVGMSVAFLSLVWKETVNTFPSLRAFIRRHLSVLARKPLFCGFCATSWIAFFATLAIGRAATLIDFFLTWFGIAVIALVIRHVIILLEEATHWAVHTLNGQPDDIQ